MASAPDRNGALVSAPASLRRPDDEGVSPPPS